MFRRAFVFCVLNSIDLERQFLTGLCVIYMENHSRDVGNRSAGIWDYSSSMQVPVRDAVSRDTAGAYSA